MAYQLKRLQARHYKIMDLLLLGKRQCDIAEEMGLSKYGVSIIARSPVFQDQLARRRVEHNARLDDREAARRLSAREFLDNAARDAAKKQISLLLSSNERVAQVSAMDILDRTGHPKVSRSEGRNVNAQIVIDEKVLERMQKVTRQCFGEDLDLGMLKENDETDTESV